MNLRIAVLPGDGIGPEIMKQGVAVLDAVAKKYGHQFEYEEALVGAHAIDDDVVDVGVRLVQNRINRRRNRGCVVACGCYDGYLHFLNFESHIRPPTP